MRTGISARAGAAVRPRVARAMRETNLFSGLVRSARNGERMHVVYGFGREVEGERKRYRYLTASKETGARFGGPRVDYPTFEAAILSLSANCAPKTSPTPRAETRGRTR